MVRAEHLPVALGFIGSHLVKQLKVEGFWVRGVGLKLLEFAASVVGRER